MIPAKYNVREWRYPAAVWLVVLCSVFATEGITHMLMPVIWPAAHPLWLDASVDAVLVTFVLAPVFWWLLVRPLRKAIRVRTDFVADLFHSIEADRRRTAHDLHDGVGQSLTILISGLKSAESISTDKATAVRAAEHRQLATATLADVKRLALGLRPSLLDDLGLAPALEKLIADVREHHAILISLDVHEVATTRLAVALETAIFRIVQEALANVVEHSRATHAEIVVRREHNRIVATITDDGVGMSTAKLRGRNPGHLGLSGMRERATLLGGKLTISSSEGKGTRIAATIPIEGAAI